MLDRILEGVSDDPDIEWLAIDATVIRVQAQAAGARVKREALEPRLSDGFAWVSAIAVSGMKGISFRSSA